MENTYYEIRYKTAFFVVKETGTDLKNMIDVMYNRGGVNRCLGIVEALKVVDGVKTPIEVDTTEWDRRCFYAGAPL